MLWLVAVAADKGSNWLWITAKCLQVSVGLFTYVNLDFCLHLWCGSCYMQGEKYSYYILISENSASIKLGTTTIIQELLSENIVFRLVQRQIHKTTWETACQKPVRSGWVCIISYVGWVCIISFHLRTVLNGTATRDIPQISSAWFLLPHPVNLHYAVTFSELSAINSWDRQNLVYWMTGRLLCMLEQGPT